jgi:hypothetical protein
LNTRTEPINTKVARETAIVKELGSITFRTQTNDEAMWRDAMTPRPGFRLALVDIDAATFRIEVQPDPTASDEPVAERDINPNTLSPEDLATQAAILGVDVKPGDRQIDLANRVTAKARKKD